MEYTLRVVLENDTTVELIKFILALADTCPQSNKKLFVESLKAMGLQWYVPPVPAFFRTV